MAGEREQEEQRSARVAAMTGIDRATKVVDHSRAEFPPWLDLVAPAIGVVGLIAAAVADGGPHGLAIARTLVGAAFLGAVTDAMLLGHWYLVQPGLGRGLLNELVRLVAWVWPFEVAVLLWPTGMIQVLDGHISDSYGGLLGWFWIACVDHHDRAVPGHPGRTEGALLLRRHGCHGPAVPGHPHGLRDRPGGAGRSSPGSTVRSRLRSSPWGGDPPSVLRCPTGR